jgi:hypothetical protein
MLEAYAFLAMFIIQIVVLSVVYPSRLIRHARLITAQYPPEQFPQLYPRGRAVAERRVAIYRALNVLVAVAGLALLGWFITYTRRPDWDDGPIEALLSAYFMLEFVPLMLFALTAAKDAKIIRNSFQTERRTATLERRGLFDFVSPFVVFLALLCYPLFIALCIYIDRNPFSGWAGAFVNIGIVTFTYALFAFGVYHSLYGKKNPLLTHADRMRMIDLSVKVCVYACLFGVVGIASNFALVLLDAQRWEPFAQSVGLVIVGAFALRVVSAAPRQLKLDGLRPSVPETRSAGSPG